MAYALQLNRTRLLFIPLPDLAYDRNTSSGTVVQVYLRGEGNVSDVFAVEQASITRTIETLIVGHVNGAHELPHRIIVEGAVSGYTLIGARKPWSYGRGKQFHLGNVPLRSAEHKWIFCFEVAK